MDALVMVASARTDGAGFFIEVDRDVFSPEVTTAPVARLWNAYHGRK